MPYVYLLQAKSTRLFKIGMTDRTVAKRLKEINGKQSPFPIVLVKSVYAKNARKLEKELHEKFAKYRKHNEWFELNPAQLNQVKRSMDNKKSNFSLIKLIAVLFALFQISTLLQKCDRAIVKQTQQRGINNGRYK